MLRRTMTTILLLFLLLAIPHAARATVVERLIAVIDGEPYTLSNVRIYAQTRLGRSFPAGDLKQITAGDREVLEQFLTDKLLEAEVREAGINVTDAEVERYIDQVKKNNRLTDEDLKLALGRENHTLASYKASVKAEMEKSNLVDRQVRRKITISDQAIAETASRFNEMIHGTAPRMMITSIIINQLP